MNDQSLRELGYNTYQLIRHSSEINHGYAAQLNEYACWVLCYLTMVFPENDSRRYTITDQFVYSDFNLDRARAPLENFLHLLNVEDGRVVTVALKVVGYIVTGSDRATSRYAILAGCLENLGRCLRRWEKSVKEEAIRVISDIAVCSGWRVDQLIESKVVRQLVNVLAYRPEDLVVFLHNATQYWSSSQLALLSQMFGNIHSSLRSGYATEIILKILDITTEILVAAEKESALCNAVEHLCPLDIVRLLYNDDDSVYKKSFAFLEKYLWTEMRFVERCLAVRGITLSEQEKGYYAREDCAEKMSFESIIEGSNCFLVLGVFI